MTFSPSLVPEAAQAGTDRPVIVGIGGSAGAVTALQHFFDAVPKDPGIAFVVVLHLAPEKRSDGAFEVESAPGEGTRVTIAVPWQTNGSRES